MVKFVIAMALIVAFAPTGVSAQRVALQAGETLLEVEAEGVVKAVPDVATFSTGITSEGATAKAAIAQSDIVADRLIKAVKEAGLPTEDIATDAINLGRRYRQDKDGDDTDEVIAYRAITRLKVRVRNLGNVSKVMDALVNAGATDLEGPGFGFDDDRSLKSKARQAAILSARQQADDYASALGLAVGPVLRVSERSANTSEGSDIVVTGSRLRAPIMPGIQNVSVKVWIDYTLVSKK